MYYYIHWTRLLCTGIIPFSYLSYMNMRIYNRMRQTSLSTVRSRSSTTKKASNLAAVLIVIGEDLTVKCVCGLRACYISSFYSFTQSSEVGIPS